jgi:hypothetical protein
MLSCFKDNNLDFNLQLQCGVVAGTLGDKRPNFFIANGRSILLLMGGGGKNTV